MAPTRIANPNHRTGDWSAWVMNRMNEKMMLTRPVSRPKRTPTEVVVTGVELASIDFVNEVSRKINLIIPERIFHRVIQVPNQVAGPS